MIVKIINKINFVDNLTKEFIQYLNRNLILGKSNDSESNKIIYTNGMYKLECNNKYIKDLTKVIRLITLEIYPGHIFYEEKLKSYYNRRTNHINKFLSEGWALYCEFYYNCLDYNILKSEFDTFKSIAFLSNVKSLKNNIELCEKRRYQHRRNFRVAVQ